MSQAAAFRVLTSTARPHPWFDVYGTAAAGRRDLADGLADVALRDVGLDQRPVRALPRRLRGARGEPRLDGLREASRVGELPARRVQRVQPQLTEALAFELEPVVVPVGQQIGERTDRVDLHRRRR